MLVLDTEASASLLLSSLQVLAGAKIWTMRIELLKHLRKVQAPQKSKTGMPEVITNHPCSLVK